MPRGIDRAGRHALSNLKGGVTHTGAGLQTRHCSCWRLLTHPANPRHARASHTERVPVFGPCRSRSHAQKRPGRNDRAFFPLMASCETRLRPPPSQSREHLARKLTPEEGNTSPCEREEPSE